MGGAQAGHPPELRDADGSPVTAEQAREIIAEQWTVPEHIRRSKKTRGRPLNQSSQDGFSTRSKRTTRFLGTHDSPAGRPERWRVTRRSSLANQSPNPK